MLTGMKACANCGVPLAEDQRYCLECGGRQLQARSQFLDRFTPATLGPAGAAAGGVAADGASMPAPTGGRAASVTALAGVGVLLLAMGVGILIGRASNGKTTVPPQVISVSSPAAPATGGAGAGTSTPTLTSPTTSTPSGTAGSNGSSQAKGAGSGATPSSKSSTSGSSSHKGSGGAAKSTTQKSSSSSSGESAEQKARNIPNVVTTG